ncbi:MAG TPA: host attachment protein [Reyranella sp.]|jgi:protein required for attachment to host cells|nr:host attachment protein [Reyranella sp.]
MKPRRKRSSLAPGRPEILLRAAKQHHKRTLVVVADSARARFFNPSEDGRALRSSNQVDMVWPESRAPRRELRTDKPGRATARAGGNRRGALKPPHDYKKVEKHRFTLELAHALNAALEHQEFDQLVLVAPRRTLGELRKLLPRRVSDLVAREIGKDLTADRPADLWRQLAPDVRPLL